MPTRRSFRTLHVRARPASHPRGCQCSLWAVADTRCGILSGSTRPRAVRRDDSQSCRTMPLFGDIPRVSVLIDSGRFTRAKQRMIFTYCPVRGMRSSIEPLSSGAGGRGDHMQSVNRRCSRTSRAVHLPGISPPSRSCYVTPHQFRC